MSSRLINVRLDHERLRRVNALRAEGIAISDLVREAMDRKYSELPKPAPGPRDVDAMLESIYREYPDEPEVAARVYGLNDRAAVSGAISEHFRAKHEKAAREFLAAIPLRHRGRKRAKRA